VQVPTLVLRCRHDNGAPLEQGRLIARAPITWCWPGSRP